MARTESTMLELGTKAPDFSLPDTTGRQISLADFADAKGLLVVFMCNHCPYVIHIRDALVGFAEEYQPQGLAVVAINSNDADNYPDDSPEKMVAEAAEHGFAFPYLYDEDQSVAKTYMAACTPDFFLFDDQRKLVYRGQFDASRPRNDVPVTGVDMRAAVDALLNDEEIPEEQTPSMGCNIKWKEGNEPDYYG
jgi:peroxiredoxin